MPDPAERRTSERFPVNADAACSFAAPVGEDLGQVKIKNISMEGIGLLTVRPVEAGTVLAIGLANKARNFNKTVLVRVAHATPVPGGCLVGGTFTTPLTYQEMSTLVL
jgi:PilZ domain-containing protein